MGVSLNRPSGWSWGSEDGAWTSRRQTFGSGANRQKSNFSPFVSNLVEAMGRDASAGKLSAVDRRELQSLGLEKDPEMFWAGLIAMGGRLEAAGKPALAAEVYGAILNFSAPSQQVPADVRRRVQDQLNLLQGKGSFGRRVEVLGSHLVDQVVDPRFILPMFAGTLAGEIVHTTVLGRLMGAGRFSPGLRIGLGTRVGARSLGFLTEASTFAAATHAFSPNPGPFSEDLARASLTLGAFRFFMAGGRIAETRLAPSGWGSPLRKAVTPAMTLFGLAAAHKAEERLGLRPPSDGGGLVLDTAYTAIALGLGSYLGQRLLGPGWSRFHGELKARNSNLERFFGNNRPQIFAESAVPVTGRPLGQPVTPEPPSPPAIWMSSTGEGGPGGRRGPRPSGKGNFLQPVKGSAVVKVSAGPRSEQVSNIEINDLQVGQVIDGRYQLEDIIGVGGMGVVWRAKHQITGKTVAIKVLRPEHSANEEALGRFTNEARAASSINNPHIIDISDAGRLPNGEAYIVMEHLAGYPLDTVIAGTPLPASTIFHLAGQLADGLAAAHHAGILHRDLKPANIFLAQRGSDPNFVKILDFGIAKMWSGGGKKLTREGFSIGTPEYMSPEQATGSPADQRSDIYSFGIILYEMATGQVPFQSDDIPSILLMHLNKAPTPLHEMNPRPPEIPPGLEGMIFKAIAKRPEDRYQNMAEVIADLREIERGGNPFALSLMPPPPMEVPPPPVRFPTPIPGPMTEVVNIPRKKRWPIYGGLAAAGLTGILAAYLSSSPKQQEDRPAPPLPGPIDPPEGPHQTTVVPLEPDAAPAAPKRRIELTVVPKDARVYRGDEDLGVNPVLELEEGSTLELTIRRQGFKDKKITLDGSEESASVRLDPVRTKRPPKPKPKPKEKPFGLDSPFK